MLISILQRPRFPHSVLMCLNWNGELEMKMRNSSDLLLIMRTIVFRTNIDILFLFHFLHYAFATLLIFRFRIILYFPHSPISTFRTPIPHGETETQCGSHSLPPPPPHRWEKRQCNVFIVFPQDLGKSYFLTCTILLWWFGVVWPLQDIIYRWLF